MDSPFLDRRDEGRIRKLCKLVQRTIAKYHRVEIEGLSNLPDGPAVLAGNHSGAAYTPDTWMLCAALYERFGLKGLPFGLMHQQGFEYTRPILGALGAVPGNQEVGAQILRAGYRVLVYPGGDRESTRPFLERHRVNFFGHRGFVRLAQAAEVPIVPIVTCGGHSSFCVLKPFPSLAERLGAKKRLGLNTWPLVLSLPWGITWGPPPPYLPLPVKIRIRILPAVTVPSGARDPERSAVGHGIEARMQHALTNLSQLGRADP